MTMDYLMSFIEQRSPVFLSILAALATLGMKFAAYALTNSVSLLSEIGRAHV